MKEETWSADAGMQCRQRRALNTHEETYGAGSDCATFSNLLPRLRLELLSFNDIYLHISYPVYCLHSLNSGNRRMHLNTYEEVGKVTHISRLSV